MESQMYVPLALGVATLVSLIGLIIGQIMTWLGVRKIANRCPGVYGAGLGGTAAGAAGAAAVAKSSALKAFFGAVFGKIKKKLFDKTADTVADEAIETVKTVAVYNTTSTPTVPTEAAPTGTDVKSTQKTIPIKKV